MGHNRFGSPVANAGMTLLYACVVLVALSLFEAAPRAGEVDFTVGGGANFPRPFGASTREPEVGLSLGGAWFPAGAWGLFASYDQGSTTMESVVAQGYYMWDEYTFQDRLEQGNLTFGMAWRLRPPEHDDLYMDLRLGALHSTGERAQREWGESDPPDIETVDDYRRSQWGWGVGLRCIWAILRGGGFSAGLDCGIAYRRAFGGYLKDTAEDWIPDPARSELLVNLGLVVGRFQ